MALLGDSAHAMQPNLGQGGCMAIEDSFQLALDMSAALDAASGDKTAVDLRALLRDFTQKRVYRVSAIHGMAGQQPGAHLAAASAGCVFWMRALLSGGARVGTATWRDGERSCHC